MNGRSAMTAPRLQSFGQRTVIRRAGLLFARREDIQPTPGLRKFPRGALLLSDAHGCDLRGAVQDRGTGRFGRTGRTGRPRRRYAVAAGVRLGTFRWPLPGRPVPGVALVDVVARAAGEAARSPWW